MLADLVPVDLQQPRRDQPVGGADLDRDLVVARGALARQRSRDAEIGRRRRIERRDAEIGDLEAGRSQFAGVEALDLVERGARRDLERMKTGWRARRDDPAAVHHGRAGIDRHPVRPRQVLAELHVRLAAVLQETDRAPRTHGPIDQRARVRGAVDERDDEQEAEEKPAHGRVMRAAEGRANHEGGYGERAVTGPRLW